jgi:hypothetical protein
MGAYRSRVKLTIDLAKLQKAGLEPQKTQRAIYDFFLAKGFTYHRHLGFLCDRELTCGEWEKLGGELRESGWFPCLDRFDTDLMGEPEDLTHLFRDAADGETNDP